MYERKAWTKEEDQLLMKIMAEEGGEEGERKLKWNDIASQISQLGTKVNRKGKQCRERWFNQLHPNITKDQVWLHEEEETLFSLQEQFGNHWAKISKSLPGRSDNSIKNYFYSCLRKALRKVNNYVYNNKRLPLYKNIKPFQKTTLSKILTVAENKAASKVSISKEEGPLIARQIKKMLVTIQINQDEDNEGQLMPVLVQKIQEFNRICKRKKTKKKVAEKKEVRIQSIQGNENAMIEEDDEASIQSESSKESSSKDDKLQDNAPFFKESSRSWLDKQEPKKKGTIQLSSTSIHQAKKIRTEIIIPTCKYNCSEGTLLTRSQPLQENISQKTIIRHSNSMKEIEGKDQPRKEQLLPSLPFFEPYIYNGSPLKHPSSPIPCSYAPNRFSSSLNNSSFSICPNDVIERFSTFASETKIKEEALSYEDENKSR